MSSESRRGVRPPDDPATRDRRCPTPQERHYPGLLGASLLPVLLFPMSRLDGGGVQVLIAPVVVGLLVIQTLRAMTPLRRSAPLDPRPLGFRILALLTALGFWLPVPRGYWPARPAEALVLLIAAAFFLITLVRLLSQLARAPRVSLAVLAGAAAGYVLLGCLGGLVATMIESSVPGSFSLGEMPIDGEVYDRLLYFSFVTIASLGYGDVLPISAPAQRLAILLSLSGTFYLSLLLGLLLGRYISVLDAQHRG
ncbi:MAG: potassium channel family protein [Synechococcaceae cyanobacterium]|nr:potassium channel family protein [Synechococcaceae cyanobacterium]